MMDGGPPTLGTHADLMRTSAGYAELMHAWAGPADEKAPAVFGRGPLR